MILTLPEVKIFRGESENVLMPFRAFDDSDPGKKKPFPIPIGRGVLMPFRAFDDSDPFWRVGLGQGSCSVLMPFRAFDDSD